jgi:hypothetical protein
VPSANPDATAGVEARMTLLITWKVVTALVANLTLQCIRTHDPWCVRDASKPVTEFYFDDLVNP